MRPLDVVARAEVLLSKGEQVKEAIERLRFIAAAETGGLDDGAQRQLRADLRLVLSLLQPGDAAGMVEDAEGLAGAATEGPWTVYRSEMAIVHGDNGGRFVCDLSRSTYADIAEIADAAFIARSRTLVPQLAAEVRRLGAVVKAVEAIAACEHKSTNSVGDWRRCRDCGAEHVSWVGWVTPAATAALIALGSAK